MSLGALLLSGLVVLATHALEAITGFGCTVLALPFVTAILGLKTGVMVLTILAWVLALYIAVTKRRDIDFRQYGIILGFVLLGLPLGMYLFRTVEAGSLKRVLAVFIVAASALQLAKPALARRAERRATKTGPSPADGAGGEASGEGEACAAALVPGAPRWLYYLLLVAGGVVHGLFSSGGPFVVLYAAKALPDKGKFRATLCLLWTTLNTVIIASYFVAGTGIGPGAAKATAAMLPFLALGILVGERLHKKATPAVFSTLVFAMLLATGVVMLFF